MRPLTAILFGDPGNGKSTLALSGPGPRLIIDAEAGAQHAHRVIDGEVELAKMIRWNPIDPIPTECEDTCVVSVLDFDDLAPVSQQLRTVKHPFRTISVDSVTVLQERLHKNMRQSKKVKAFKGQDWTESKNEFMDFVREIRDLSVHPTNPIPVIVFTALAQGRKNEIGVEVQWPNIEGGAHKNFPGSVDVCGFVRIFTDEDTGEEVQIMLIHGNPKIIAKTRSPLVRKVWGSQIENPNLEAIWKSIQEEQV
jgi:hypothetical protein